jgi:hypothetical protein
VVPIILEREERADARANVEGGSRLLSHDTDDTRGRQYRASRAPATARGSPVEVASTCLNGPYLRTACLPALSDRTLRRCPMSTTWPAEARAGSATGHAHEARRRSPVFPSVRPGSGRARTAATGCSPRWCRSPRKPC